MHDLVGITRENVIRLSELKGEPEWMLEKRLKAFEIFEKKPMQKWGPKLDIDFSRIRLYSARRKAKTWDEVPEDIRTELDALGIPEAEKKVLAGVEVQYDSGPVYEAAKKVMKKHGIIFTGMDTAVRKYPDIVKEWFGKIVPPADNKFAALNTAVWSGGSFIYVPEGVEFPFPLHAFFLIGSVSLGQFERTLIVAEEDSSVHYIEGCSAPAFSEDNLHAAVVEIVVKKNARVRYTTIQNWSKNVLNLTTKRAFVMENGKMSWVDGNVGSKTTMKYPSCYLMGENASGELLSIAYATKGQMLDAGGKMIHLAPRTRSRIISKAIVDGGKADYRGMVRFSRNAKESSSAINCDTLMLGRGSSASYPVVYSETADADVVHETTAGKINEAVLFYLMSRGFDEERAVEMVALGFISEVMEEIPLEYALELNKLIKMRMEGSIG